MAVHWPPALTPLRRHTTRRLTNLVILAAVHALLLPLYGPIFDYHFGERQLYHTHLYTDLNHTDHVHLAQAHPHPAHIHSSRTNPSSSDNEDGDSPATNGVVSIPAPDASDQLFIPLELTSTQAIGLPSQPADSLGASLLEGELLPAKDIFLPPPEKPPYR